MSNKSAIISLVAETHIHAGVGQSTGALDLPVARERTTDYPFIPGSGVKGAMRVWAKENATGLKIDNLFGKEGQAEKDEGSSGFAGNLLCSDARLLLLPVRCLSDAFKWVTCSAMLERYRRDCERAGIPHADLSRFSVADGRYMGMETQDPVLGLEEREFAKSATAIDEKHPAFKLLSSVGDVSRADLENRLVIISDRDFGWFARYALPVMARNVLEPNTKKSENLWYEESLAPDTIMYLLLGQRGNGAVKSVTDALDDANYIQMGGNETIGQGWFRMRDVGKGD